MSDSLYKITRHIVIFLSFILSIFLIKDFELLRLFMYFTSASMFIIFSFKYQKKRKIFTIPYLFVFIIIYLVYSFMPAFLTQSRLDHLNATGKYGIWFSDEYFLYYIVTTTCYFLLILYITVSKYIASNFRDNKEISMLENKKLTIACIILTVSYIIFNKNEIMIVALSIMISKLIFDKNNRLKNFLFLLPIIFFGRGFIVRRYEIVQIFFPIIMMVLVYGELSKKNIGLKKMYIIIIVGCFLILLYGVVSEIFKLNSSNYSFTDIFGNIGMFVYSIERQLYRLFAIWIKLGGYIIYHTKLNGYFYGMTFVKSLASFFGFKYVSLPAISAVYDGAIYAQPGLLAEGYANFGILGSVLNISMVFILMEALSINYLKNRSYMTLLISTIPFSQILFDGGTFNSAIVLIIICLVPIFIVKCKCILNWRALWKKNN